MRATAHLLLPIQSTLRSEPPDNYGQITDSFSSHASTLAHDTASRLHSVLQHLRRRLHHRDAGAEGRAGARAAHSAPRAVGVLDSRGAHRRGAREHAAARGRILPLGAARVRAVLGLSARLDLVDVIARPYGDLPAAVQPVSGVLRSLVRRWRALGGVAARHLERDG